MHGGSPHEPARDGQWARAREHPILTGVTATVVGGLIVAGVLGVIHAATSPAHPGGSPAPNSGQSGTSPVTHPSTQPVAAERPLWSGPIGVSSGGSGIDLDSVPPAPGSNNLGYDASGGILDSNGNYQIAIWNGRLSPGRTQCTNWAKEHPSSSQPAQTGTAYCILTGQGHTAYLKITGIDANMDFGTVYAQVMIWATTGQQSVQALGGSPSASVRWHGQISVSAGGSGIDLDFDPPATGSNNLEYDAAGGILNSSSNYEIAIWNGSHPPTYRQCHVWAQTHPNSSQPAETNTSYCIVTGQGHTAYLKITSIDPNTDSGTVNANVTVWSS